MTLLFFGYLMTLASGIIGPTFVVIQGKFLDSFDTSPADIAAMRHLCLIFFIIGLMLWLTFYFYFTFLVILATRIGTKTKIAYFKAVLR